MFTWIYSWPPHCGEEGNGKPPSLFFPRYTMGSHNSKSKRNGVKGTSRNRGASLGRPSHVRQVGPDRHSASVRNRNIMRIGTWNVRTLYQKGKLNNVVQEMNRMRINILGISETRWTGSGEFTVEKHKMIYSGGIRHERGVGVLLDHS